MKQLLLRKVTARVLSYVVVGFLATGFALLVWDYRLDKAER